MWLIPETQFNIPVISDPDLEENCCHTNVEIYVQKFGGSKVEGAYILQHYKFPYYYLVEHSIWKSPNDELIDITPFSDNRITQFFVEGKLGQRSRLIQSPVFINIPEKQEIEMSFYVYAYFDKDNVPFYVGKGSNERAYDHLRDCWGNRDNCRFHNKLRIMLTNGQIPTIKKLIENIEVEEHAYTLEEDLIKQYGRQGYEENGTLLNTCIGANPPSHKGKTYQEIYGDRWKEQIEKRRAIQLSRGGFGPKKFSDRVKSLLSWI